MTVQINDVHTIYLGTSQFSTGNAFDATGNPAYRIYEGTNNTPVLTGSFALIDDPNTTGAYAADITLSAANGFEVGKTYGVYATATVNGVLAANFLYSMIVRPPVLTAAEIATAVMTRTMTTANSATPTTVEGYLRFIGQLAGLANVEYVGNVTNVRESLITDPILFSFSYTLGAGTDIATASSVRSKAY
jgi:hypothetical protein